MARIEERSMFAATRVKGALVLAFMVGGLCGYAWFRYSLSVAGSSGTVAAMSTVHPLRLGSEGLVNPLLEYTTPRSESQLKSLNDKLGDMVQHQIKNGDATDIGVYARDLNAGEWAGVNEADHFSPGSLLKVPTMIAYLKLAETEPDILNKQIAYDDGIDDNALEQIKPLKAIEKGRSYTVEELIKFMIDYSDNNAARLLLLNLGQDADYKVFTDIGVPPPTSYTDYLSPRTYSLFFRVLYNATYLNVPMSQKALTLLTYSDFPQGIAAGVPEHVAAATKFGERTLADGTKELHECGIIYHPDRPYVLCVMTKGNDFVRLTNVIQALSSAVYKSVDSDYKS